MASHEREIFKIYGKYTIKKERKREADRKKPA